MKLTAYQGSPFTLTTGDKYIVQQRNAGHEGVMGYFRHFLRVRSEQSALCLGKLKKESLIHSLNVYLL